MAPLASDLLQRTSVRLAAVPVAGTAICLGLSGGLDSVVLLDLLDRLRAPLGFHLTAVHVNHGLSPHAADWGVFCGELCSRRDVPLALIAGRVTGRAELGLEAAARRLRHAAYAAQPADFVALAHHQDDQVETMLLQLLRGAGVKGAAGMPVVSVRRPGRPCLLRPLLGEPRSVLEKWAGDHGLHWIEDESNRDDTLERNFLRRQVLPLVASHFPGYRVTLSRAAAHFAEADRMLEVLARDDADGALDGACLRVQALTRLTAERARNVLRHFLIARGAPLPGADRLAEMVRQVGQAGADRAVCFEWGGVVLWRQDGSVRVAPRLAAPAVAELDVPWGGEPDLDLGPGHGRVRLLAASGEGIAVARLDGPVRVRLRRGGERLRPRCGAASRTLKNLLQEAHVPVWRRARLPLLWCGDRLVWVPGIGVDCDFQAGVGEPGLVPEWLPPSAPA